MTGRLRGRRGSVRHHRRVGAVLAVVVATATVAACSGTSPAHAASEAGGARSTTTARPAVARLSAGDRYVALGDSFASGPGIAVVSGPCLRSDHNYPTLVAATLGLRLVDRSCSGATVPNVVSKPQGTQPPQLDAVGRDTRLVTLTVGDNDIAYSSVAQTCARTSRSEAACAAIDWAGLGRSATALRTQLGRLLDRIARRAPEAVVVVVTYPMVIPPEGASCGRLELSPTVSTRTAELGQQLEDALVSAGRDHGAIVADPYVVGDGHGPCADPTARWVDGAEPVDNVFPFHGTAAGHAAVADLVVAALRATPDGT